MIRHALAIVAFLALTACGPGFDLNLYETPAAWTPKARAYFAQQSPATKCAILLNSTKAAAADLDHIFSEIRKLGLNRRDIEILRDQEHVYGTGMSYRGLECAGGGKLYPNKAFYSGLGHRWQVPFGSGFVYLEGDGTEAGMRVTAWN